MGVVVHFLLAGLASFCPALAEDGHLVVIHLDLTAATAHQGPVFARLTDPTSEVEVPLQDDGVAPDKQAGDAIYSGSIVVPGDAYQASASVGGRAMAGDRVGWDHALTDRRLEMVATGDSMRARAGEVPGARAPNGTAAAFVVPAPPSETEAALTYILGGVGLLLFAVALNSSGRRGRGLGGIRLGGVRRRRGR